MRVNLIGNTCNNHYVIAKALRRAGVEAHLYFHKYGDIQTQPSSEDPELARKMPPWIHPYTNRDIGTSPHLGVPKAFLEKIADCDLLHVHDLGLIWAYQTGKPYVWHPYGLDFYQYPFFNYWYENTPSSAWPYIPQLFRTAIMVADALIIEWWHACWADGIRLVNHLGWKNRITHIPLIVDTDLFAPENRGGNGNKYDLRKNGEDGTGLTIFHPTRQFPSGGTSKEYSGNELLYRALGRLKSAGVPFSLYIVEKGIAGEKIAREIIEQVGIQEEVSWIKMMPRNQLIKWYRSVDITVAELVGGSIGSVGIEALSCGCPLMANILLRSAEDTFWPPPVHPPLINVETEEDIYGALIEYSRNREALRDLGKQGREWAEKHLSAEVITRKLIELYERVTKGGKSSRKITIEQAGLAHRNSFQPSPEGAHPHYREFIHMMDSPETRYGEVIPKPDVMLRVIQDMALLQEKRQSLAFWFKMSRRAGRKIVYLLFQRLFGPITYKKVTSFIKKRFPQLSPPSSTT